MTTTETPAQRAVSAAMLSLVAFCGCLYLVIARGMADPGGASVTIVMASIGLAVTMLLHWVFVGIAARRLGRSVWGWVVLTVVLFPIASIVAAVLYYWGDGERGNAPPAEAG